MNQICGLVLLFSFSTPVLAKDTKVLEQVESQGNARVSISNTYSIQAGETINITVPACQEGNWAATSKITFVAIESKAYGDTSTNSWYELSH